MVNLQDVEKLSRQAVSRETVYKLESVNSPHGNRIHCLYDRVSFGGCTAYWTVVDWDNACQNPVHKANVARSTKNASEGPADGSKRYVDVTPDAAFLIDALSRMEGR